MNEFKNITGIQQVRSDYTPVELADELERVSKVTDLEKDFGATSMMHTRLGYLAVRNLTTILKALRFADEEYLTKLREATNAACKAAYNANIKDAVNWGDLKCTSAENCISYDGGEQFTSYRVFVSEVSPSASDFIGFIHQYLKDHGFTEVEVIAEW